MRKSRLWFVAIVLVALLALFFSLAPGILERDMNRVLEHPPYPISDAAKALHASLQVADLHADSILWQRDLLSRSDRGHVDLPRLQAGNVALQVFDSVTKSPAGQNYQSNATDTRDNITALALAQAWPPRTWRSLTERALYQARRLQSAAAASQGQLQMIFSRPQLEQLLRQRAQGKPVVGAVLGTEGSHALDGQLDNIEVLYSAGFRIMGLQHFFDNRLGGSLHGKSGAGLTRFGRDAVDRMLARGIILDIAHSSPQVVRDVLARSPRPILVSHSGFQGHCDSHRNISDELMQQVAQAGGLVGVGFWEAAVCDASPAGIASAIAYGISLLGADHVALGSDFDGAVTASFDISEVAAITQALLDAGVSEKDIRKVMGGNILRFLSEHLPDA